MSAFREPPRPTPTEGGPDRTAAWLLAGLLLVLGVVAVVFAVNVLTAGRPSGTAATPSPSASSAASMPSVPASDEPSYSATDQPASASPSPDILAELGLRPDLLPAGSVVQVAVDGVRIREAPSTESAIVATMRAGDAAFVVDHISAGPVSLDGYEWYMVEYSEGNDIWPWQDVPSGELVSGWMAAGTDELRFATLRDVRCPEEPVDLEALAFEVTAWERLVCLRGADIVVEGFYGCDGCGGITAGAEPAWLADPSQHLPIAGSFGLYPFIWFAVPPDTPVPETRDLVRATLHVDDPAAGTCTYVPPDDPDVPTGAYDPIAVETYCRERLILDSFEVVGP